MLGIPPAAVQRARPRRPGRARAGERPAGGDHRARSPTTCSASSRRATPTRRAACSPSRRPRAAGRRAWPSSSRAWRRGRCPRSAGPDARRAAAERPSRRRRPSRPRPADAGRAAAEPAPRAGRAAEPSRRRSSPRAGATRRQPAAGRAAAAPRPARVAPRRRAADRRRASRSLAVVLFLVLRGGDDGDRRPRRPRRPRPRRRPRRPRPPPAAAGRRRHPAAAARRARRRAGRDDRLPPGRRAPVRAPGRRAARRGGEPVRRRLAAEGREYRRLGFANARRTARSPPAARARTSPGEFPQLFATYDRVIVSQETTDAADGADARRAQPAGCPAGRGYGQQLPGVHDPRGVELRLDRPQRREPRRPRLRRQPRRVVAADRVVVGDGRARRGDRVAGRALGPQPLPRRIVAVLRRRAR